MDKARSEMMLDFERQREAIVKVRNSGIDLDLCHLVYIQFTQETEKSRPGSNRFVGQNDFMEETLKKSTVGLVRLEDFQNKRKELEEAKARAAAQTDELK